MSEKIKEMQLTDEMKEALKGSLGFNVNDNFNYVTEDFRKKNKDGEYLIPKSFWPVWSLRSKDGIESADVEDSAGFMTYDDKTKESKMHIQSGKNRIENLKAGIVSVKNFLFEDGSRMDFDRTKRTATTRTPDGKEKTKAGIGVEHIIRFMRPDSQLEISNAINERKVLTVEEQQGL